MNPLNKAFTENYLRRNFDTSALLHVCSQALFYGIIKADLIQKTVHTIGYESSNYNTCRMLISSVRRRLK